MIEQSGLDASADRLIIHTLSQVDAHASLARDVREGLSSRPRRLFPKYFYDELGSQLFEAICLLPEYYLTRAENEIFERYADEIVASVEGETTLLEMGSGSASKTRRIIEALINRQGELHYIPVDISASALETSSLVLLQSFPALHITAYAGDYFDGLAALRSSEHERGRTLALFLGSNIGNFDADGARTFLSALRSVLSENDALLLGADLKKQARLLEEAYDDSLGVTAAFNLNLLARLNRELDADFDLRAFHHQAVYNEVAGSVEIYLVSAREQTVHLRALEMEVQFREGERIHTENSHKYDLEGLSKLAAATGFTRARTWLDQKERFSSNLFIAVGDAT